MEDQPREGISRGNQQTEYGHCLLRHPLLIPMVLKIRFVMDSGKTCGLHVLCIMSASIDSVLFCVLTCGQQTEIYRQVFHAVPDDMITTWKQYTEFIAHHGRFTKPVRIRINNFV